MRAEFITLCLLLIVGRQACAQAVPLAPTRPQPAPTTVRLAPLYGDDAIRGAVFWYHIAHHKLVYHKVVYLSVERGTPSASLVAHLQDSEVPTKPLPVTNPNDVRRFWKIIREQKGFLFSIRKLTKTQNTATVLASWDMEPQPGTLLKYIVVRRGAGWVVESEQKTAQY